MFVPPALLQSQPANEAPPWQSDLAAFDAELASRKASFASKRFSVERKEDVKQILSGLRDLDQFGRRHWDDPRAHGYAGTPEEQAFFAAFQPRMSALDAENLRTFK